MCEGAKTRSVDKLHPRIAECRDPVACVLVTGAATARGNLIANILYETVDVKKFNSEKAYMFERQFPLAIAMNVGLVMILSLQKIFANGENWRLGFVYNAWSGTISWFCTLYFGYFSEICNLLNFSRTPLSLTLFETC